MGAQINAHTKHGVDQADAVRSRVLAGFGDGHNVGDVGGELDDNGLACDLFHCRRHLCGSFRAGAEAHAAAVDVGAADVDLQPAHLFLLVQSFAGVGVIRHGKAGDVGHDRFVKAGFQLREFFGNDLLHAGILQPHGVDHAACTLGNAGGGISEAGFFCGSLEGEGTEAVDVIQFGKFVAVTKGAGGGDDRIVQLNAAEIHAQASHKISSFFMTGPSLQMRL